MLHHVANELSPPGLLARPARAILPAMRIVLQRVRRGRVTVADRVVGEIGRGLVLLVGIRAGDGEEQLKFLAEKCVNLRIFPDDEGKMNRSLADIGGGLLVVSQFTLYGECRKGRRPNFGDAAPPDLAEPLYERFVAELRQANLPVATGIFGAHMLVDIENDGPVTLLLEKD